MFVMFGTWTISIFSIVYGSFKLCKHNISQKMRHLIIVRHILTLAFLMLANMYLQLGIVYFVFTNTNPLNSDYNNTTILVLKVIFAASGILLPLTRLLEPYFYTIILRKVKEFFRSFCCLKSKQHLVAEQLNDMTFLDRGIML